MPLAARNKRYATEADAWNAARKGEHACSCVSWLPSGRLSEHWHVLRDGEPPRLSPAQASRPTGRPVWVREHDGTMRRVN